MWYNMLLLHVHATINLKYSLHLIAEWMLFSSMVLFNKWNRQKLGLVMYMYLHVWFKLIKICGVQ